MRWWLVASVALVSCGSETRLVLEVASDLAVPGEVNRLSFGYRTEPDGPFITEDPFELVSSRAADPMPRTAVLPVQFGVFGSADEAATLEIRVALLKNDNEIAVRQAVVDFTPMKVELRIDRECARALCPEGTTCVSGRGCVAPALGRDGRIQADAAGPRCRCESFFPFCVGARWWIDECPVVGDRLGQCERKSWVIGDYGEIGQRSGPADLDEMYGKRNVKGFVQIRTAAIDRSRRWISEQNGRWLWEKDQWFDEGWTPIRARYRMPGRLRFDENRRMIGETWKESGTEVELKSGVPAASEPFEDEWEVIPAEQVPLPHRARLNDFSAFATACQRRRSFRAGVFDEEKIFCFATRVGKILEINQFRGEYLAYWDTPCSNRLPPSGR